MQYHRTEVPPVGKITGQNNPLHHTLKPVDLLRGVTEFGHLDGPANVFRAQDHPLGDVSHQVRFPSESIIMFI